MERQLVVIYVRSHVQQVLFGICLQTYWRVLQVSCSTLFCQGHSASYSRPDSKCTQPSPTRASSYHVPLDHKSHFVYDNSCLLQRRTLDSWFLCSTGLVFPSYLYNNKCSYLIRTCMILKEKKNNFPNVILFLTHSSKWTFISTSTSLSPNSFLLSIIYHVFQWKKKGRECGG